MNSKKLFTATGLFLALALFVAFNTLSRPLFSSARLDLTQEKLYTLSQGSRNILANLGEPVTLRFFFSKKLAKDITPVLAFGQRVQELVEEYVAHSGGKLKLQVLDPEPYSEEEEQAVDAGLQGVPLNAAGETLYFGLAGSNTGDDKECLPFIRQERESLLEYDLTRMIYNLAHPTKKVVGLLSKLPMEGNPMARYQNPDADAGSWFMLDQIRERFEVRTIPDTIEKVEDGIDVLMVVHPQGLSPRTLYAIDQYVLGGGKLLVFVDPNCIAQEVRNDPSNPYAAMMADKSSDLGPLLGAWGLEFSKEDVAADKDCGLRVRLPQGGDCVYTVWLGLSSDDDNTLDKGDAITAQLKLLQLATCGILTRKSDATTTITPLLETTKNSMKVAKSAIQFGDDPKKLFESFVSGGEKLLLAARVHGPAKTAYPEGQPKAEPPAEGQTPEKPKDQAAPEGLKESKSPINVVVVADADMLADRWWTRTQNFFGQRMATPTANNNDFVLNALENLSGNDDLISLRGRGNSQRPFDKVNEIRREADKRFLAKENELEQQLKDLKTQLGQLQKGDGDGPILSDEQRKKIEQFREQQVATSKELRRVKHERNQEIESLGTRLKLMNTFLLPLLVVMAAFGVAALRPKPKGG